MQVLLASPGNLETMLVLSDIHFLSNLILVQSLSKLLRYTHRLAPHTPSFDQQALQFVLCMSAGIGNLTLQ